MKIIWIVEMNQITLILYVLSYFEGLVKNDGKTHLKFPEKNKD